LRKKRLRLNSVLGRALFSVATDRFVWAATRRLKKRRDAFSTS